MQESLLKALRAEPDLRDEDKLLPWFYRILNNAITDVYRHKHVEAKYHATSIANEEPAIEPEDEAVLCACFRELIPT
ncbi:MAG: sigma factor, partial [bacterium]